jgi:TfoX/Sxy family transcriptional regulator of competence genes
MPYAKDLAARVRDGLAGTPGLTERKMFGGIAFMLHGHMCCGVIKEDLVLRLGAAGADEALGQPFTRPMDFTGRPMKGYVYVAPAGIPTAAALGSWLRCAVTFAQSLPAKRPPAPPRARSDPSEPDGRES